MDDKQKKLTIPGRGAYGAGCGLKSLTTCGDGFFTAGFDGVESVTATGDGKVEFIAFRDRTIAYVNSALGYPAYYPVYPVSVKRPVRAVLMDLDGTSVRSEDFWIWIIEMTTASLTDQPDFRLSSEDLPYVSGHSVSEHLAYCIKKYCPKQSMEAARKFYFTHTHREMNEILEGRGRDGAFTPTAGVKEFLLALKARDIRIGLVTSGLYEKAWPEIASAFKTLDMGDPKDFYDCAITAGFPLRKGSPGTLGELSPKPHPWLYAETAAVGLGIPFIDRASVIGIEDSGAGICSIRLAGFAAVGLAGGNIEESGTKALCEAYCESFDEILKFIDKQNV
jgi:beta-phosphoglucomutase-like phosphatase (HAD superfamily)